MARRIPLFEKKCNFASNYFVMKARLRNKSKDNYIYIFTYLLAVVVLSGCNRQASKPSSDNSFELPRLYISISDDDLDSIRCNKQYRASAFALFVTPEGDTLLNEPLDNIHTRGNATFNANKKSYTMKLLKKKRLLGLDVGKRFVLLANPYDKSHIRNAVAFDLAREMGLKAPKYEFISLYVNSKYQGLYQMTNKVEDLMDFVEADGYLIYKERKTELQLPRHVTKAERDSIFGLYYHARSYISNVESSIDSLQRWVDLASFARFCLLLEITQRLEGEFGSFYIHALRENDGMLHAGPIWDFDVVCKNPDEIVASVAAVDSTGHVPNWLMLHHLWKREEYRDMMRNLYLDEVYPICQAYLESGKIERLANLLCKEVEKDYRQNRSSEGLDYDKETRKVRSFLEKRIVFLYWYFTALEEDKVCIIYPIKYPIHTRLAQVWFSPEQPIAFHKIKNRIPNRETDSFALFYKGTDSIVPDNAVVKGGQTLEFKKVE